MTHFTATRSTTARGRAPSPLLGVALALGAAGLAGCAAKGATLGAEIDAAGAQYASIAEEWEDGNDKVKRGRKLLRRGRDRVRDGEDDIELGEQLMREGEAEMAQSKRNYDRLRARSPGSVGPAPGP